MPWYGGTSAGIAPAKTPPPELTRPGRTSTTEPQLRIHLWRYNHTRSVGCCERAPPAAPHLPLGSATSD